MLSSIIPPLMALLPESSAFKAETFNGEERTKFRKQSRKKQRKGVEMHAGKSKHAGGIKKYAMDRQEYSLVFGGKRDWVT